VSTLHNPWFDYVRIAVQTTVIFGLPVFSLRFFHQQVPVSVFPERKVGLGVMLGLGVFAWLLCLVPVNGLWELNKMVSFPESMAGIEESLRQMQRQTDNYLKNMLAYRGFGNLLVLIVLVAILPSIFEELFFRGVLQQLLFRISGAVWPSIILAAVIFSVFHAEFFAFLPRVLLGILLGVAYASTGKLWLPMLLHFLNNVSSVLFHQFLSASEMERLSVMGTGGFQWALSLILLLAVFVVFRLMLRQNRLHP
jgi:hypothetical protein